jgi:LPXTG-motif cell wall-anchored protein
MNKWWAGTAAILVIWTASTGVASAAVNLGAGWTYDETDFACIDEERVGSSTVQVNDSFNPELVKIEGSVSNFTITVKSVAGKAFDPGQKYSFIFSTSDCTDEWPEPYLDFSSCIETTPSPLGALGTLTWRPYSTPEFPGQAWMQVEFTSFAADEERTLTIDTSACEGRSSEGDNSNPGDGGNTDPGGGDENPGGDDLIGRDPVFGYPSDYRLPTVPTSQALPDTGSSTTNVMLAFGTVLIAAGGSIVIRSRRTRSI